MLFSSSQELSQHPQGLEGALQALQQEIRSRPGELKLRVLLFQLLALMGQWQRALAQLQVVAKLDAAMTPLAQTYRSALRAEVFRADVFAGKRTPQILGEPKTWVAQLIEALQQDQLGQTELANSLRLDALDAAPEIAGRAGEQEFAWLADGDVRLGPILEAVIQGQYYWLSFDQIAHIRLEAPADLRDLVWAQARITLINEGEILALLPARYPDLAGADDLIRLSRKTDWKPVADDMYFGQGQKMWMTDQAEFALLDVREVHFQA